MRLPAHLARMKASAGVFSIPFDEAAARTALDAAVEHKSGPLRVRLALDETGDFTATAAPLSPPQEAWTYALSPRRVSSTDRLARHKTDWRELYDRPAGGADEWLFLNERGELVEGARTNIFLRCGETLLTPPLGSGCLAGVLRAELLDQGRAVEATLTPADIADGDLFLGNSLRGLVRAVSRES